MKKLLPTFLTVAALGTVGAQGAAIHAGLLNYWALDSDASDTAGSFAESTGATTDNGSVNGSTSFAAGLFGNAASFPGGAGNNITVADSAASSAGGLADDIDRTGSDMTLSVWFKASAWTTNWQAIVSHGEGQDYRIARQNNLNPVQLAGVIGTSDIVTTAGYGALDGSDATWHNITITGTNGGNGSLYVDGSLIATSAALADPTVSIAPSATNGGIGNNVLCIGCNPDNGREFNGLIDDIGLWDRELSATEVALIYSSGQNGISLGQIPEPTTGLLGLLGVALILRRRK